MVFGRGAGTRCEAVRFREELRDLRRMSSIGEWVSRCRFAAFDYFNLRDQREVQEANVQAEHARYNQSMSDVNDALEQAQATLAGARQLAANTPVELAAARASEQQQQVRYRSGLATVVDVAAAEGCWRRQKGMTLSRASEYGGPNSELLPRKAISSPFCNCCKSQAKGK